MAFYLHTLDEAINRQEDPDGPLPTFCSAHTQDHQYKIAIDVFIFNNFISFKLARRLNLSLTLHPEPYVVEGGHHILHQCRLPFRVGSYDDELLLDVVYITSVGLVLGRKWIEARKVRYNKRRKAFIYPWMKKTTPPHVPSLQPVHEPEPAPQTQPDPVVERDPEMHIMEPEPVPEPKVSITVQPTPLVESESEPTPMPAPAPMVDSEAIVATTPMEEPAPMMKPEPLVEPEPALDPEPLVAIDYDPTPLPAPDPSPLFKLEPSPEPVTESDLPLTPPEEIKIPLLHEYLDPFLTEEPDPSSFQLNVEDSFCEAFTIFSTTDTIARPAAQGIHHQLLESRLYSLRGLNSRTSFFPPGENDGNQIVDRTNPIKLIILCNK